MVEKKEVLLNSSSASSSHVDKTLPKRSTSPCQKMQEHDVNDDDNETRENNAEFEFRSRAACKQHDDTESSEYELQAPIRIKHDGGSAMFVEEGTGLEPQSPISIGSSECSSMNIEVGDSGHKKHICSFPGCGMAFSKSSRLLVHTHLHYGKRPYVCEVEGCGKSYTRPAHLRRHKSKSHSTTTQKEATNFRCEYADCDHVYLSQASLKKHLHRFHQRLPYSCQEEGCIELFRKRCQLRQHILSHHSSLHFKCSYEGCGKVFDSGASLSSHIKKHQGYVCSEEDCGKTFGKWSLLRKHMAMEHKPKYTCTFCDKELPSKTRLREHTKTHSETRELYRCTWENCGRAYSTMYNLKAHVRSYHDSVRFECHTDGCTRKFSTKQKLDQHQKMHDPNKPLPKKRPKKGHRKKTTATRLTGIDPKQDNIMSTHMIVLESDEGAIRTDTSCDESVVEQCKKGQPGSITEMEVSEPVCENCLTKLNSESQKDTSTQDAMEEDTHIKVE